MLKKNEKNNIIMIHWCKHSCSSHYKLDNHVFEQVEENQYLGVAIHKNPKWASHINKISTKANYVLGFIQRKLKHANRDQRELAYTLLVGSILEYSSTVWDPLYQKDIDRLEKVQRRAPRFVFNFYKPISSVRSMVSQLGWKPLAEKRRDHRLSLLYICTTDNFKHSFFLLSSETGTYYLMT